MRGSTGTQTTRHDAMDLAYLAGQCPQDRLNYDERDIRDGFLFIGQGKAASSVATGWVRPGADIRSCGKEAQFR